MSIELLWIVPIVSAAFVIFIGKFAVTQLDALGCQYPEK